MQNQSSKVIFCLLQRYLKTILTKKNKKPIYHHEDFIIFLACYEKGKSKKIFYSILLLSLLLLSILIHFQTFWSVCIFICHVRIKLSTKKSYFFSNKLHKINDWVYMANTKRKRNTQTNRYKKRSLNQVNSIGKTNK